MYLRRLYEEALSHGSYILGCPATGEALVVDPNRDIEQYVQAAVSEGLRITSVTETHIHADYLSGSRELARRTGAQLYLSADGGAEWQYDFAAESNARLLSDGDSFNVGGIRIDVVHTPGHTPEHLCFLVTDEPATEQPIGIFTGDFVFVGDVGRPDLLERSANVAGAMEPAARQLFQSLQQFKTLSDYLQIWPAHGAGSACGKSLGGVPQSTVGYERISNWAFPIEEQNEFVQAVLSGQPDPPAYFATMKQLNRLGPPPAKAINESEQLTAKDLSAILGRSELVVDVRMADSFAERHIPGTINIPLNRYFAVWAGSLISYDQRLTVLALDESALKTAHRGLMLIGLERNARFVVGDSVAEWRKTGQPTESTRSIGINELSSNLDSGRKPLILDVRGESEWENSRIAKSLHIPLGTLMKRVAEIPRNREVIVTSQAGNRSPIAASILRARGFAYVVNLEGGIDSWVESGRPPETSPIPPL